MATKIKYIVFIFILAMLILPAIQGFFHIFPEKPLNGEFEAKDLPVLKTSGWVSGTFQSAFDPWLEENIGFHNVLVRLNNQVDYSIFHAPNAEGVVAGMGSFMNITISGHGQGWILWEKSFSTLSSGSSALLKSI